MQNEDSDKPKDTPIGQLTTVDRVRLVVFGSGSLPSLSTHPLDFSNKKSLIVALKEHCSESRKGRKTLLSKMKQRKRATSVVHLLSFSIPDLKLNAEPEYLKDNELAKSSTPKFSYSSVTGKTVQYTVMEFVGVVSGM